MGGLKRLTTFISLTTALATVGGVFAMFHYSTPPTDTDDEASIHINEFTYLPEMPSGEVSLLQRLDDILNQRYTTPNVQDSREYLLNDTIKAEWDTGAAPYVGSMDPDLTVPLHELFGDIIDDLHISFILKNQDLNWDGLNEIALYSTSDPLDYVKDVHIGIVGVYLSVFTPIVDEQRNVIGYTLVCDSMYGLCNEVNYNPQHPNLPSFSTDDWVNNLVYWHHELDTQLLPENAPALNGEGLYIYDYESYHSKQYTYEGYPWGYTTAWIDKGPAKTAAEMLDGKIPYIPWY